MLIPITQAHEVNYQNRQLKKELVKIWDVEFSALIEMPTISAQSMNEGKFFKVLEDTNIQGYVYIGRIISCRAGGCSKDKSVSSAENYEYFDAFFIYDASKTLQTVKVFNYRATHGHEVCSRGWLKQFIGYKGDNQLEVNKSIDGISGATISVHALTDEVNYITQLLQVH